MPINMLVAIIFLDGKAAQIFERFERAESLYIKAMSILSTTFTHQSEVLSDYHLTKNGDQIFDDCWVEVRNLAPKFGDARKAPCKSEVLCNLAIKGSGPFSRTHCKSRCCHKMTE